MGHVTAPARKEERLPSLRRSLSPPPLQQPTNLLRLNRLAFIEEGASDRGKKEAWAGSVGLRGAGWEKGSRTLSGHLVWHWRRPQDVHSIEVFLLYLHPALARTLCPLPLWLGTAWTLGPLGLSFVCGPAPLGWQEGWREDEVGAAAEGWVWECVAFVRMPVAGNGRPVRKERSRGT